MVALISVADFLSPTTTHLGPLLALGPALAAAFAGPRLTALVGVVALGAQELVDGLDRRLGTTNHLAQLITLAILSALMVATSYVRERRAQQLTRTQSVAEAAQRVLLRPPPHRIGPLRIACLYLAAENEAQIGGDLFAAARGADPCTRVVVGDVRGKGLASIGEASVVLGAFREGAQRCSNLPELATTLEESVYRDIEEVADVEADIGEHFITALVLEIPDQEPFAEMINCGHPPPLLIHRSHVGAIDPGNSTPPLGVSGIPLAGRRMDTFAFEAGDIMLLYTDGAIEARSPSGEFYPLAERLRSFAGATPEVLLREIHRDLVKHVGEEPGDDVALLAIERLPARHEQQPRPMAAPSGASPGSDAGVR
ncbi:PP2C family protein-serine/threonine phosphatase [Streptomyces sp. NPDC087420]|uniref:PP2C family protein-serine/threonine phosphatase n=1 Tax=Streptomyces sp. NPDC087420 TaxID=3365785 RepID=UPI003832D1EB